MSGTLIAIVKRECPTCELVIPVLREIQARGGGVEIHVQDDPAHFAALGGVIDDTALETSWRFDIEIVPTLIRLRDGQEAARAFGWNRDDWQAVTGLADLGAGLPANRPGCGSKSREPGMAARLKVRFGNTGLKSRRIAIPESIDPVEACFDRGWTDGLAVVPPTEERVLEMLDGTPRAPDEVIGAIPPNRIDCTVEKVAINAVMAGCKPDYMPVVLSAIETALMPGFSLHGVLATTNAVAPVIMVNGPVAKAIGMNAKGNVFGQGNRANGTIGRALQLVVRNVGGGRPGEIDRAVFGSPGKYSFCFAEDEEDGIWESFAVSRGFARDASTVTVFSGDGVTPVIDHTSRRPEDLCRSYAGCLRAVYNTGHVIGVQAMLVVGQEHANVFYEAGWSKDRVIEELKRLLMIPIAEVAPGRAGLTQLTPEERDDPDAMIPKFRTGTLNIVRAGGAAGKYSAIISSIGSEGLISPVTREIRP